MKADCPSYLLINFKNSKLVTIVDIIIYYILNRKLTKLCKL